MPNWEKLTGVEQIAVLRKASFESPVLIFKHSTTCSISSSAKSRLERQWQDNAGIQPYYLDLLSYRPVSQGVSEAFGVRHESPQVLLIIDGECRYTESHYGINFSDIAAALTTIQK